MTWKVTRGPLVARHRLDTGEVYQGSAYIYQRSDTLYGMQRTLTIKMDNRYRTSAYQKLADNMWRVYERAVAITNEAFAKGLGYIDFADMQRRTTHYNLGPRLKDWLKIQRTMVRSRMASQWTNLSQDFILGQLRKNWKLDNHQQTKRACRTVLGQQAESIRTSLLDANPSEKAKIFRETLLAVICSLNLENVYIRFDKSEDSPGGNITLGTARVAYGAWRTGHSVFDANHPDIAFDRGRMEEHLVSDVKHEVPIYLSPDYMVEQTLLQSEYANLFGATYTNEDLMTITLLHEASHMFAGTEDHWYFEPNARHTLEAIRCDGWANPATSHADSIACDTNLCVLNADTIGWFLFWYGGGKTLNR